MKRRNFIKTSFLSLAGISLLSGLYAWQIEPFRLEIVHIKMPIKNLPKHLIGKTLMQISDIHIGNRFDFQFIIDSFKIANQFKPDFVVYTGDYISLENGQVPIDKLKKVLKDSVKGSMGTLAILGNHDYGVNWSQPEIANQISDLFNINEITILRNEQIQINGLNFIGLDDFWGLNFNPEKALQNFNKSVANIALCHNPDVCDLDIWKDYDSWILSGHTHGGQVKPPFLTPPLLPVQNKAYSSGIYKLENDRTLYINRALGHLWQVRFNVRPEISLFQLQNT
jgi:predicted MPP superfamily phosphohydrolase